MLSPEVLAIALGFPGRVNRTDGMAVTAGYLDLKDVPLAAMLNEWTQLPACIDTDANMALYAEMRVGAAIGASEIAMLTIGTGIGGAIVSQGRLFYGGNFAGQLGHISVDRDGELCNCGRRGCIETKSSGTSLNRLLASSPLSSDLKVQDLLQMELDGDFIARELLVEWVSPLRRAVDSLAAVLNPELILLGGGLGKAAHEALVRLTKPGSDWFDYELKTCTLGDDAGVIGAGLMALDRIKELRE